MNTIAAEAFQAIVDELDGQGYDVAMDSDTSTEAVLPILGQTGDVEDALYITIKTMGSRNLRLILTDNDRNELGQITIKGRQSFITIIDGDEMIRLPLVPDMETLGLATGEALEQLIERADDLHSKGV